MANPALRRDEFALVSPEPAISKMKTLPVGALPHRLFWGVHQFSVSWRGSLAELRSEP